MARIKKTKDRTNLKLLLGSIAALSVGYFLLNHMSTWEEEDRIIDAVFYIVTGCIFIAVGGYGLVYLIRRKYFPKKSRRKSRPVFLDDSYLDKKRKS